MKATICALALALACCNASAFLSTSRQSRQCRFSSWKVAKSTRFEYEHLGINGQLWKFTNEETNQRLGSILVDPLVWQLDASPAERYGPISEQELNRLRDSNLDAVLITCGNQDHAHVPTLTWLSQNLPLGVDFIASSSAWDMVLKNQHFIQETQQKGRDIRILSADDPELTSLSCFDGSNINLRAFSSTKTFGEGHIAPLVNINDECRILYDPHNGCDIPSAVKADICILPVRGLTILGFWKVVLGARTAVDLATGVGASKLIALGNDLSSMEAISASKNPFLIWLYQKEALGIFKEAGSIEEAREMAATAQRVGGSLDVIEGPVRKVVSISLPASNNAISTAASQQVKRKL